MGAPGGDGARCRSVEGTARRNFSCGSGSGESPGGDESRAQLSEAMGGVGSGGVSSTRRRADEVQKRQSEAVEAIQ